MGWYWRCQLECPFPQAVVNGVCNLERNGRGTHPSVPVPVWRSLLKVLSASPASARTSGPAASRPTLVPTASAATPACSGRTQSHTKSLHQVGFSAGDRTLRCRTIRPHVLGVQRTRANVASICLIHTNLKLTPNTSAQNLQPHKSS
eukprot:4429395-Pyramimonas_sp.AAC.2